MEYKLANDRLQALDPRIEELNGLRQISRRFLESRPDNDEHHFAAMGINVSGDRHPRSLMNEGKSFGVSYGKERASIDGMLLTRTRAVCERNKIEFGKLSPIQRKFVTHYRCNQCGLLPLYHLNLLHVKRVRCRKCGQLVSFKRRGKYGKLRKEIALEFVREIDRDVIHAL